MEKSSTDQQLRAEELLVLKSIYGDDLKEITPDCQYQISFPLSAESSKVRLNFSYTLPESYPSQSPPTFSFSSPHPIPGAQTASTALNGMYQPNKSVLYTWIEWLRENLDSIVPPPQEEPTPAAKVHGNEEAEWEEEDVEEYLEEEEEEEGICSLWLYLRGCVLTIEDEDDYYCDSYDDSLKYGRVAQAERSKPVAKTSPTSALKPSPPATDVHPAVYTGPTIHHGTPVTDRKSKFVAHLALVRKESEVESVLDELKRDKKIAEATHNIVAYRLILPDGTILEKRDDDGETGAGDKLLYLMRTCNVLNAVVVVTRWYGGIHLGADRFKHITGVAKEILTKHGLIGAKKTEETQPEAAEPGKRLRPAHEVYNRIKWDSSLNPADYVIGYEDRFEGVKQISFQEFEQQSEIPFHRIRFFKKGDEIVWDRRSRIDKVFNPGPGSK